MESLITELSQYLQHVAKYAIYGKKQGMNQFVHLNGVLTVCTILNIILCSLIYLV